MFLPENHGFLKITKTSEASAPKITTGANVNLLKLKIAGSNPSATLVGPAISAYPAIKKARTKMNKMYFLRLKISIFTSRKRTSPPIYFTDMLSLFRLDTREKQKVQFFLEIF